MLEEVSSVEFSLLRVVIATPSQKTTVEEAVAQDKREANMAVARVTYSPHLAIATYDLTHLDLAENQAHSPGSAEPAAVVKAAGVGHNMVSFSERSKSDVRSRARSWP